MAVLLADVGGTNARLAIARDGAIDTATLTRFRGDDYARFDDVVADFLTAQGRPPLKAVCVAVAGPVSAGRASLTNRDWDFSEDQLSKITGADHCRLINDLTALGYAVPALTQDGVAVLYPAPAERPRNGQALVVGAGTGFNVCPVHLRTGAAPVCLESEYGHASLPNSVMSRLSAALGPAKAAEFPSVEECFAGRGLSQLHALLHDIAPIAAENIAAAAAEGDTKAAHSYRLFADLFGELLRDLAMQYMPREGIYLAGSVARSLAQHISPLRTAFLSRDILHHIPENTPLMLIRDDMAALQGCLVAGREG